MMSSAPQSIAPESTSSLAPLPESTLRRLLDETSDLIDSPPFTHVLTQLLDAGFSTLVDRKIAEQTFKRPSQSIDPSSSSFATTKIDITSLHALADKNAHDALTATDVTAGPAPIRDEEEENEKETEKPKAKVANILAVITRQAHIIGCGDVSGTTSTAAADTGMEMGMGMGMGPDVERDGFSNEYLRVMDHCQDLDAFAAVIYSSNFEHVYDDALGRRVPEDKMKGVGEGEGEGRGVPTMIVRPSTPTVEQGKKEEEEEEEERETKQKEKDELEEAWDKARISPSS